MGTILNLTWLFLMIGFPLSESQDPQPHCLWPSLSGPCEHCERGWYGDRCEYSCTNCDIGGCYRRNGTCFQCHHGLYSINCDKNCPEHCRESYDEKVYCDRNTGNCLEYCKHGWWGDLCEKRCSDRCVDNACFFYDGSCINDCRNGWFGKNCDRQCPAGCLNGLCARYRTGQCTDGCKKGFYGNHCNKRCDQLCIDQDCFLDSNLKIACRRDCKNGWSNCRSNCSKNCNSCHRESGQCLECKTGFMGPDCQRVCNDRCFNKTCDTSGRCTRCKRGYFGENCQNYCGDKCLKCMDRYEPCKCQEHCRDVEQCLHDEMVPAVLNCNGEETGNKKRTMTPNNPNSGCNKYCDFISLYTCLLIATLQSLYRCCLSSYS